uniref:Putative secreted peptide n=1 Tax=Anopheles braziliensis TaxID=58242 RepID=A0A2M3ZN70_9DIPT
MYVCFDDFLLFFFSTMNQRILLLVVVFYRVCMCASFSQPPLPGAFMTAASLLQISVLRANTALPANNHCSILQYQMLQE